MNSKSLLTMTFIVVVMFSAFRPASAQIPRNLTVQGVITDSTSKPVADGIHTITLRLYDKLFGGNQVYQEEYTSPIFKGLFNLTLGTKNPLPASLSFDKQYFVGISYDGNSEIARIPLSSVPYSLMAETVPDGSITSNKIADGSITLEKLSLDLRNDKKTNIGLANFPTGLYSFIGGGNNNVASGSYSSVVGGNANKATGIYSIASGGNNNISSGTYSVVGGGSNNISSGVSSSLVGGSNNTVTGMNSLIGGGNSNIVNSNFSSIIGGNSNIVSALFSTIVGGNENITASQYSVILGGNGLLLSGTADRSLGYLANTGSRSMTISDPNIVVFGNTDLWLASNDGTTRALKLFSNNLNASGAYPSTTAKNVAIKAPNALANDYILTLPADAGSSGQTLTTNGSGVLSWASSGGASGPASGDLTGNYPNPTIAPDAVTSAKIADGTIVNADISSSAAIAYSKLSGVPTSLPPSGAAGGDLSGTYPSPSVATVGGQSASNVAAGVVLANNATSANTASAIVRRDASGDFTTRTLTLNGNLSLPTTTSGGTVGTIKQNGSTIFHSYGAQYAMFLGEGAGTQAQSNVTYANVGIGAFALQNNTSGAGQNTAVGVSSMNNSTSGVANTALGFSSLSFGSSGNFNSALGVFSLVSVNGGSNNTGVGYQAGNYNTTGNDNVYIGSNSAASGVQTTGSNNVIVGATTAQRAGPNTSYSSMTLLGYGSNMGADNLSNATAIGANTLVSTSNSLVLGNNANVGIGTSSPSQKLEVRDGNVLLSNTGTTRTLSLQEASVNGTNFVGFKAPNNIVSDVTWTLPDADGSNNQVLQTNGSGTLNWTSVIASGASAGGDLSGTYPSPTIAGNAVTSAKIADNTIIDADINSSAAIAYSKLNLGNSIINSDINSSAAIAYSKLNLGLSILTTDLSDGSVTGPKIGSNAVTTSKIADNTIQSNDIKDGDIAAIDLASNSVTTVKIADNNVTGAKIALGSDATGDIMYYDGTDYARRGIGSNGDVLTVSGGVPTWAAPSGGGGSTIAFDHRTTPITISTTSPTYTTVLSVSLSAGKTYSIDVIVLGQKAGATSAPTTARLHYTGNATTDYGMQNFNSSVYPGTTFSNSALFDIEGNGGGTTFTTTTAPKVNFTGYITTSTSGTLSVQVARATTNTTDDSIVREGSYIIARPLN